MSFTSARHRHNDGVNKANEIHLTERQILKGKAMRAELKTPKAGMFLTISCFFFPIIFGCVAVGLCKYKKYREQNKKKTALKKLMEHYYDKEYDD